MSRLSVSPTDLPMVPRHMPYEKKEKEKMSRSRNGCLTCRIRRKKCTELKDAEGTCEACSRLSIECLGYAEKRPAWMKDHAKLEACKKEIRCWLAERGSQRSKGGRLSLAQYYGDEAPEPLQIVPHMSKPRNPTSSARRQNRKEEAFAWASQSDSDERDELQDEPMNDGSDAPDAQGHSGPGAGVQALHPPHHHLNSAAHNISRPLAGNSSHLSASRSTIKADPNPAAYKQSFLRGGGSEDLNDELESESETELDAKARSSNSLDRVTPTSRQNNSAGAIVDVGGTISTFKVSLAPSNPPGNEAPSLSDIRKYDDFTDQTLAAWGTDAPPNERRFTQPEYARELYQTMWSSKSVQNITRHFLTIDCFKKREPGVKIDKVERRRRENELSLAKQLLQQSLEFEKHHDGHGMAAVFGVTCVLNRGGTGDWKSFLDMACAWLEREAISILQGATKLSHATAFLAEVTMWIDIMSSPSFQRSPKLQRFYPRFLTNDASQDNHGIYLSKVMGCDNQVLLGIAETSALAGWKEDQVSKGCLDVQRLCDGGRRIEATFLTLPTEVEHIPRVTHPLVKAESNATSQVATPPTNASSDSTSLSTGPASPINTTPSSPKTAVTANGVLDAHPTIVNHSAPLALALFHATRVYLHTVVSGSFPDINVIANGVTDGIACLQRVNVGDLDRSIAFSMCALGSMARTVEQKNFFTEKFRQLAHDDRIGNLVQVMRLVQEVWSRRERADRRTSIDWWNVSREVGGLILLA